MKTSQFLYTIYIVPIIVYGLSVFIYTREERTIWMWRDRGLGRRAVRYSQAHRAEQKSNFCVM